jgi:hypothetical protein
MRRKRRQVLQTAHELTQSMVPHSQGTSIEPYESVSLLTIEDQRRRCAVFRSIPRESARSSRCPAHSQGQQQPPHTRIRDGHTGLPTVALKTQRHRLFAADAHRQKPLDNPRISDPHRGASKSGPPLLSILRAHQARVRPSLDTALMTAW